MSGWKPFTYRLGRWRAAAAVFAGLLVLAVVGIPLVNLASKAGIVVAFMINRILTGRGPRG